MASKAGSRRHIRVCLLSSHSLVLKEIERSLKKPRFWAKPFRVENNLGDSLRRLPTSSANVYVVDSNAPFSTVLVKGILNRFRKARILVLAEKFDDDSAYPFLQLGAKGLMLYSEIPRRLSEAIEALAAGGFWLHRALLSRFLDSFLPRVRSRRLAHAGVNLSPRERQVLDGLLENLSNKEIANRLRISERTAKFHVSNLLAKFHVQHRADLVFLSYHGELNKSVLNRPH
jgi:DNA-binding NarL/FixJ family response regulator